MDPLPGRDFKFEVSHEDVDIWWDQETVPRILGYLIKAGHDVDKVCRTST